MEVLNVSIIGEFEDVHPYMDYLLVLTPEREVQVVDWQAWLEDSLSSMDPRVRDVWQWALGGNSKKLPKQAQLAEDEPRTLTLPAFTERYIVGRLEAEVEPFADWTIYNRALYIAGEARLSVFPLRINGHYDGNDPPITLSDLPALQLGARWGVLAASCGTEGFLAKSAYVWESQMSSMPLPEISRHIERPADRVSWFNYDLFAIAAGELAWYRNAYVGSPSGLYEGEQVAMSSFGISEQADEELFAAGGATFESGFASKTMAYLWNANQVMAYGFDRSHHLDEKRSFTVPAGSIYAGMTFAGGIALDTDRGTFHVNALNLDDQLVSGDPNLVVRVFNRAQFYKRQVWSVKQDRLDISIVL